MTSFVSCFLGWRKPNLITVFNYITAERNYTCKQRQSLQHVTVRKEKTKYFFKSDDTIWYGDHHHERASQTRRNCHLEATHLLFIPCRSSLAESSPSRGLPIFVTIFRRYNNWQTLQDTGNLRSRIALSRTSTRIRLPA